MEIKIDDINNLSLDRQGNLLYNHQKIGRWWGKTLYRVESNQLICWRFNLIGLFLRLFGYKKEFNSENLTSYLKNNIKTLTGKENITQSVAFEALGKFNKLKSKLFCHEYKSEEEAIALFEEQGLDVNAYDRSWGQTALMWACYRGEFELVKYLIDKKADINYKGDRNRGFMEVTALHVALKTSFNLNVIELLIDHGADLDVRDANGASGFWHLVFACAKSTPNSERRKTLLMLIDKALVKNPNSKLCGSYALESGTVMQIASKDGDTELLQLLNKHGVKIG